MRDLMADKHQKVLATRAVAGDRAAFDELFELHRNRLLARIRSRLSDQLQRRIDPEDVLQDAICKAFETVDRFRWQGENSFYAWVAAIAEHLILNATKKKQLTTLRLDRDVARSTVGPEKALSREERYDRLRSSLGALSPDQRTVVILARIEGLPAREIARRMERSEVAVRKLLSRALRELKKSFGDTESLHLPHRGLTDEGNGDERA